MSYIPSEYGVLRWFLKVPFPRVHQCRLYLLSPVLYVKCDLQPQKAKIEEKKKAQLSENSLITIFSMSQTLRAAIKFKGNTSVFLKESYLV